MIYLILGVIIGVLLAIVSIVGLYTLSRAFNIKNTMNHVTSKFTKRGEVFEAESDEVSDWVDNLKKQ